ncbi:hypothetical protein SAMN05216359_109112 [Roseateles sp. YR242]|uniref:hypothetical protein n=1 Tax=Roseateles sp. YR242 TaxID=1855305 RepID=UPI0008D66744|nr:hypothetical protein [Roseateles sp. YR242]SEL44964.1 hypothetical protein SAMN05216359_109112 [Roseateles sp. YR242]
MIRSFSSPEVHRAADLTPPSTATRTPLPDQVWPPCFSQLRPYQPVNGATIGECFLALRQMEAGGLEQKDLRAHLYQGIALASLIEVPRDEPHRSAVNAAAEAFARGELHPSSCATKSRIAGLELAFNWVVTQWPGPTKLRETDSDTPVLISKPIPVNSTLTAGTIVRLDMQMVAAKGAAGSTLAATPFREGQDRPWLVLRVEEHGQLIVEAAPVRTTDEEAIKRAEDVRDILYDSLDRALSRHEPLSKAIDRYNEKVKEDEKLRLVEMGKLSAHQRLELPTEATSSLSSSIRLDYRALAGGAIHSEYLERWMAGDSRAEEILQNAQQDWAPRMEAVALARVLNGSPPKPGEYRADLVKGCIVQVVMEWMTAMDARRVVRKGGVPAKPSWTFLTPISLTRQMLRPLEQVVVHEVIEEVTHQAPQLRERLTKAPTHSEWPTIAMDTGIPRACLCRTYGADEDSATDSDDDFYFEEDESDVLQGPDLYTVPAYGKNEASLTSFDSLIALAPQPGWIPTWSPLPHDTITDADATNGATVEPLSPFNAYYDQLMDRSIEEIRTPGNWRGFGAELAPRFITDCPGWPTGQGLEILNNHNGDLMSRCGSTADGSSPIRLVRDCVQQHYMPLVGPAVMSAPANGDCFYFSVLAAMSPENRKNLLQSAIPDVASAAPAEAVRALRSIFATFLEQRREDYRERILGLHVQVEGGTGAEGAGGPPAMADWNFEGEVPAKRARYDSPRRDGPSIGEPRHAEHEHQTAG